MNTRPVIIWGAGRIGRGFNAEAFSAPGYRLVFVDMVEALIEKLRAADGYTVYKAQSSGVTKTRISGFEAYTIADEAGIRAHMLGHQPIVSAAVHASMLDSLAGMLAPYLRERARKMPEEPMDILLNVNMFEPDKAFRAALGRALADDVAALSYVRDRVGLVVTVVMRITPMTPPELLKDDPLAVYTNGYPELVADARGFKGEKPVLPMLRLSENILAEEVRKIYTLNMAHATSSYLGMPMGLEYAEQAAKSPALRPQIEEALSESAVGLRGEYGFSEADMAAWNQRIMELLDNPYINDDLRRLGADSERKLSKNDRLVGAAQLCLKHGGKPTVIAKAIRAGFSYENDDDGTRRVRKLFMEHGLETALREVCGLDKDDALYGMVLKS